MYVIKNNHTSTDKLIADFKRNDPLSIALLEWKLNHRTSYSKSELASLKRRLEKEKRRHGL